MATTCPRCHAEIQPDDRFCPTCGQRLTAPATTNTAADFTPIGAGSTKNSSSRRKRRKRRPWYRRWRLVVPLVLIGMILLTLGAGAWYIKTRFDTLNELSTPPPQISGDRLGGDEELTIDTGPAQDAVREAEARREAARNNPPPTLASTEAPGSAGDTSASGEDTENRSGSVGNAGDNSGAANTESSGGSSGSDDTGSGGSNSGGAAVLQSTAVIEVNPQGTPILVSEPVGTPTLADVPEPVQQDSYAFLMMGVDARPGEAIDVGVRPDSLFVVYLDGTNGSCRVLSIPRDTRTTLPGYGQSKINHALAVGGVPYEQLVVENLLGIEIQHYGLIDFSGVEQLVDAVGGVTVDNEYAFSTGEFTFPEGRIELNGEEALAFSRFRHDDRGDFGRQERQQAVVRALLTKGAGMDVVTAIPSLLDSVDAHVRTDLGPNQMVDIAQDFRSTCNGATLKTERIEGRVAWAYDDVMQMDLSFVLVDPGEVQAKTHWLLTGSDEPVPATPGPPPASPAASPAATAEPTRPRSTPTATEPAR